MRHTPFRLAALAIVLTLAGGCANPWKEAYEPNREYALEAATTSSAAAAHQPVEIRDVEFERLQKFAEAERQRRVSSTTAPVDLSPADKRAAQDRLLEALQLPWRSDEAVVVGSSQFISQEQLKPRTDKRLREFAQKVGADTVVLSSAYLGQTQRTEQVPITSYARETYITHSFDGRGRRVPRTTSYDSSSTTWVPMNVTQDQYVYHAFFIRRR